MLNVIVLVATITLIICLAMATKRRGRLQDAITRRFLEEEQAANAARKREIDPELYFEANLELLPPIPENDPHNVLRASRRTMLRFPEPLSNVELKKMYGVAQLESITLYEENFHDFLRTLGEWAKALHGENNQSGALQVLAYAIGLGSELRGTYKLAAEIFSEKRDRRSLEQLLQAALDNHFNDKTVQEHIVSYIEEKIGELEL